MTRSRHAGAHTLTLHMWTFILCVCMRRTFMSTRVSKRLSRSGRHSMRYRCAPIPSKYWSGTNLSGRYVKRRVTVKRVCRGECHPCTRAVTHSQSLTQVYTHTHTHTHITLSLTPNTHSLTHSLTHGGCGPHAGGVEGFEDESGAPSARLAAASEYV